jgi:hypothetical protein
VPRPADAESGIGFCGEAPVLIGTCLGAMLAARRPCRVHLRALVLGPVQAVKERPWILDMPAATGIENALRSTPQNHKSLGRKLRSLPFDPLQHAVVGLVAVGCVLRRRNARKCSNYQQQD